MYTFSPMMVANSRKHHCRVRPYTREVLVLNTNLESQTKHYPLVFRNRRGDEARIKKTWYNQGHMPKVSHMPTLMRRQIDLDQYMSPYFKANNPHAPIDALLSKKPQVLQRPAPTRTHVLASSAHSQKANPFSALVS
ncbi:hypothetical protein Tco_1397629 [Tanacetum coccineum]